MLPLELCTLRQGLLLAAFVWLTACSVQADKFDDDFYVFRSEIKELERRLGSVVTQGFDDCTTVYGRFKLLDSFDVMLQRDVIMLEMEHKHAHLVATFGADLKVVMEIFRAHKEVRVSKQGASLPCFRSNCLHLRQCLAVRSVCLAFKAPPIGRNMPPVAGAVLWIRGLKERIVDPYERFKTLHASPSMESEETKEVFKLHAQAMELFEVYESQQFGAWCGVARHCGLPSCFQLLPLARVVLRRVLRLRQCCLPLRFFWPLLPFPRGSSGARPSSRHPMAHGPFRAGSPMCRPNATPGTYPLLPFPRGSSGAKPSSRSGRTSSRSRC
eukprot:SAG22_NODE_38_length_26325_cov_107.302067_8_plen_327_part_00